MAELSQVVNIHNLVCMFNTRVSTIQFNSVYLYSINNKCYLEEKKIQLFQLQNSYDGACLSPLPCFEGFSQADTRVRPGPNLCSCLLMSRPVYCFKRKANSTWYRTFIQMLVAHYRNRRQTQFWGTGFY